MKKLIPLLALFLSPLAVAKIGDCPAIQDNGVTYQSHGDYIEATDNKTQKILWHTQLFDDSKRIIDPNIEEDVQANIACIISVRGDKIFAKDKRNHRFTLDKATGKVIDTRTSEFDMRGKIGSDVLENSVTNAYATALYLKQSKGNHDFLTVTNRIDSKVASILNVIVENNLSYTTQITVNRNVTLIKNFATLDALTPFLKQYFDGKTIDWQGWQVKTAQSSPSIKLTN